MKLTDKNIRQAIDFLKSSVITKNKLKDYAFILPVSEKILSKRYSKIGRPKKTDYDYKKIDWDKAFKSLTK